MESELEEVQLKIKGDLYGLNLQQLIKICLELQKKGLKKEQLADKTRGQLISIIINHVEKAALAELVDQGTSYLLSLKDLIEDSKLTVSEPSGVSENEKDSRKEEEKTSLTTLQLKEEANYQPFDELCASIVRSHRETSQYRPEDLHALKWKVFSREDIQTYQSKSVDEMWQHCANRLTDAVQYVVEFAKHVPGFRILSQNDQIALLKTGSMEVVLVRMCRFFNTENNTVFFDGKFAGTEVFKSLACSDLIAAVFDFAHGMCALKLTEQQLALFSALVLINAERPSLEDRDRVQRVQRSVELGITTILHRDNQDSLMHKLQQKMAVLRSLCSLHMEKLRWFSQRYPRTAHSLFPPLYKELFASEAELLPGGAH